MLCRYVRYCFTIALSFLFSFPVYAQSSDQSLAVLVEGTGTYSRPISTDSELAQKFFDQGLRLTWGCYFPSAIASHQEAMRHDDHPMVHWGMALAIAPNPNSRYFQLPEDPRGEGRKAIIRAMDRRERGTEQEQALIESLFVLYDSNTLPNRADRDQAYMKTVRELLRKFPDDPDIATLYADAFMTMNAWNYWDENGKARPGVEDTAQVMENSMARHPGHPGTNHLYIHLIEASPTPERALPQADRLAALMPNAGHMVHMSGHIYLWVGQYENAISTNEKSAAADEFFLRAWGDRALPRFASFINVSVRVHRQHSIDFVRFAAGVQGNYEQALAASRRSKSFTADMAIRMGPGQRNLTTEWLIHKMFGKWDAVLDATNERDDIPYVNGMLAYVQGSAHANLGNVDQAEQSLVSLQDIMMEESLTATRVVINPAKSILTIAALGLEGEIKQASGELNSAIAAFEGAVEKEDSLGYTEPPDWTLPMRHYLGDALLEAGRAEEAEQVFRKDLAWNQNNGWGLYGLWQSLIAQGKADEAASVKVMFDNAWKSADTELTAARF